MLVFDADDTTLAVAAPQPDHERVFAVQRKEMANSEAAVSGKRHVLVHSGVLLFGADLVQLLDGPIRETAYGGTADFRRGRIVASPEGRRDGQHVVVVFETRSGQGSR